jgi:predicted acyl esterase
VSEAAEPTNGELVRASLEDRALGSEDYPRFSTAPLTEDVVITGPVGGELGVATDGADIACMAKRVDVYPGGYEARVLDAPLRLRYRNGRMRPGDVTMMTPGGLRSCALESHGLRVTAITRRCRLPHPPGAVG